MRAIRSIVAFSVLFVLSRSTYLLAATPAAPAVTVAGADASGVKITTTTAAAVIRLPIEATADAKQFHVTVDDFRGPDSGIVPVVVTVDGHSPNTPFDLGQADRPILTIKGVFQAAGDYKSNLVFFYDKTRLPSIPITVTRQWNAISVQLDLISAAGVTLPVLGSADAQIRFSVRENAGHGATLYPPALIDIGIKESDKTVKQAEFNKVELDSHDETLSLAPQQLMERTLTIKQLESPGEYVASLEATGPDVTPVEKPVSVFVKDSGFWAFLFIFLGVLASYLVRYWTQSERPKLDALRRIYSLSDDLDTVEREAGALSDEEKNVLAGVRKQLATIERNLKQDEGGDQKAALTDIESRSAKLPAWLSLGNQIMAVTPQSIVADSLNAWKLLGSNYFLNAGMATNDFDTHRLAIENSVDAALKQAALASIQQLADSVAAYLHAHPGADLDAVNTTIADAREAANAGRSEQAMSLLVDAQARFAQTLASDMAAALAGAQPLGFTQQSWVNLKAQLRGPLQDVVNAPDATTAMQRFDGVYKSYVQALIDAVLAQVSIKRQVLANNGSLTPVEKTALSQKLDGALATLTTARGSVAGSKLNDAFLQYSAAVALVKEVDDAIAATGNNPLQGHLLAAFMDLISPLPQPLSLGDPVAVAAVPARVRTNAEALTDLIRRFDLLLNIGLLLIATILGLKLLWFDDAVWGGWKDFAIAFLWGLGLHQVGGASFEGLPALTKRLSGAGNA